MRKNIKIRFKNDKYRRLRGGKAFAIWVHCKTCSNTLILYQKDGDGRLKRCYLNRIIAPLQLENLQRTIAAPKKIPNLVCEICNAVIGTGIRHHDGRLAFRLRSELFFTKRLTNITS